MVREHDGVRILLPEHGVAGRARRRLQPLRAVALDIDAHYACNGTP